MPQACVCSSADGPQSGPVTFNTILRVVLIDLSGIQQGWIQDFPKGGANDGKGEWGVPPPTQSREAFAFVTKN